MSCVYSGPPQAVGRLLQVAGMGLRAHHEDDASPSGSTIVIDEKSFYMRELSSEFLQGWLAQKVLATRRNLPFIFCSDHERHNFGHCNPGVGDTCHISTRMAEPRSVVQTLTKTNKLLQQMLMCSDQSSVHDTLESFEEQSREARVQKAHQHFDEFDANEDGYLSKAELLDFVSHTGREFQTPKKLLQCYDMLDANGDGKISIEEFAAWWSMNRDDFTTKICSLEKAQMMVFGENQLIDRYARATGLSLVRLNVPSPGNIDGIQILRKLPDSAARVSGPFMTQLLPGVGRDREAGTTFVAVLFALAWLFCCSLSPVCWTGHGSG